MSITATPQQSHSRDVALAAIAQAQSQIGHADGQLVQLDETAFKLEKEKMPRAILLTSNRVLLSRAEGHRVAGWCYGASWVC